MGLSPYCPEEGVEIGIDGDHPDAGHRVECQQQGGQVADLAGRPVESGLSRLPRQGIDGEAHAGARGGADRSEEHTSELQSLMRISYADFCLNKQKTNRT